MQHGVLRKVLGLQFGVLLHDLLNQSFVLLFELYTSADGCLDQMGAHLLHVVDLVTNHSFNLTRLFGVEEFAFISLVAFAFQIISAHGDLIFRGVSLGLFLLANIFLLLLRLGIALATGLRAVMTDHFKVRQIDGWNEVSLFALSWGRLLLSDLRKNINITALSPGVIALNRRGGASVKRRVLRLKICNL